MAKVENVEEIIIDYLQFVRDNADRAEFDNEDGWSLSDLIILASEYANRDTRVEFDKDKCDTARRIAACADSYCSDTCNMKCPYEKQ